MKKYLIYCLLGVVSFLSVNSLHAEKKKNLPKDQSTELVEAIPDGDPLPKQPEESNPDNKKKKANPIPSVPDSGKSESTPVNAGSFNWIQIAMGVAGALGLLLLIISLFMIASLSNKMKALNFLTEELESLLKKTSKDIKAQLATVISVKGNTSALIEHKSENISLVDNSVCIVNAETPDLPVSRLPETPSFTEIIYYGNYKSEDQGFKVQLLKSDSRKCLFIIQQKSEDNAFFSIVQNPDAYSKMEEAWDQLIEPTCISDKPLGRINFVETNKPGVLKLEGELWMVETKAEISLS